MTHLHPEWFEPESEPKDKFRVRGLYGLEFMEVQEMVRKESDLETFLAMAQAEQLVFGPETTERILKMGIMEWPGCRDFEGQPVPFTPDCVRFLCYEHVVELCGKIFAKSMVMEDTEKKSESPSKSAPNGGDSTAKTANGGSIATKETPPA